MQAMGLYAANSIFVDGYLTEPGQKTAEAHAMIADLGFTVVAGEAGNPMTARAPETGVREAATAGAPAGG
jgi:biotin synthase